ncbi:MAG: phosphoribosylamine--glycine ligase [Candidatus Omnitrophica bacterium]|nr:phosphoribosylamine--glycine ligase [Candidatus Omnitrophota bacterium]
MKILIVSTYGESMPLAYRLKQEGHQVFYHITDPKYQNIGHGIVEKVDDDWENWVDDVDLIVFDDTGHGKEAQTLKDDGYNVIGGSEYTDKLELDRGFGQQQMEDAGLTILPSKKFTNIDEAIDFVTDNPGRYVIKPDGKGSDDKALTYVGKDENGEDVLSILNHYKKKFAKNINALELQTFISGLEIGVSAFFNGEKFVEPFIISFEHKKMFPGDVGPNTGEMGTTMFWVSRNHRMVKEVLMKMESRLQGYTGFFDINCIVADNKFYPLEMTCRFGYPTIELKMETISNNFGNWLLNLAIGLGDPLELKNQFSCCVVMAVPPFPYEDEKTFKKLSEDNLIIIKSNDRTGYFPSEVNEEDGEWYVGGMSGYPLIVCGCGSTMEDAISEAYDRVSKVIIPDVFYRNDIGGKWSKQQQDLSKYHLLPDSVEDFLVPGSYPQDSDQVPPKESRDSESLSPDDQTNRKSDAYETIPPDRS